MLIFEITSTKPLSDYYTQIVAANDEREALSFARKNYHKYEEVSRCRQITEPGVLHADHIYY